tara:strand:- start:640 stop:1155 length:516 start_codon:yes stop_codon:yes gene_type:complete
MSKNELKNSGHVMGYIGATILFVRFIPLLYDQFANPREINLYFLYLELLASIACGISAIFLNAFPLFIANSLSALCVIGILIGQIKIRVKKKNNLKTQNKESKDISNENTINENTITTTSKKESELKDAAKNTDNSDLVTPNNNNTDLNPAYLPLYELKVPDKLSPTYKIL